MLIPGASQYLATATLANKKGTSPSVTNVLASRGTVDLLDVAKRVNNNGIGLSAAARQLNQQFLNSSRSTYNALFGLGMAQNSTIETLIQKINAIRASLPQSQVREDLRGVVIDPETQGVNGQDNGNVSASSNGSNVNTTA